MCDGLRLGHVLPGLVRQELLVNSNLHCRLPPISIASVNCGDLEGLLSLTMTPRGLFDIGLCCHHCIWDDVCEGRSAMMMYPRASWTESRKRATKPRDAACVGRGTIREGRVPGCYLAIRYCNEKIVMRHQSVTGVQYEDFEKSFTA